MILATISQVSGSMYVRSAVARIGHDRGRIRVHQHDLVALLAQRLAGLRAGIVKLAGLTNHDRAGTDKQNLLDVVASWHRAAWGLMTG